MATSLLRRLAGLVLAGPVLSGVLAAQVWEVDNRLLTISGNPSECHFGAGIAIGDFDGDGIDDLVVGAPNWDRPTVDESGAWWHFRGSATRSLPGTGPFYFGNIGPFCIGEALASGDFDGDGRDELVVGAPCTGVDEHDGAGTVALWDYEGGTWILRLALTQDDVTGAAAGDSFGFGFALATGDFDGNGLDDLAVGTPEETWGGHYEAGAVDIFYGSASVWLRTDNAQHLRSPNQVGTDEFGAALAVGDFNSDGYDDLAVGAPWRPVSDHANSGVVEVFSGSTSGLVLTGPEVLDDNDFPASVAEGNELFGLALAAGNFDQSPSDCEARPTGCFADLAIGAPGQFFTGKPNAGKVLVAYGRAAGLLVVAGTYISATQVGSTTAKDEWFGGLLAAGRLDAGDNPDDLAIGRPGADVETLDTGAVNLVFGASGGLNHGAPSQFLYQKTGFAIWPPFASDRFGSRLAIGDLDDDGWGDLAVGADNKQPTYTGVVQVLYGALFADGFESGGTAGWSAP